MAASSESYDRWAIAAPNGKLLFSDVRGAPSFTGLGIITNSDGQRTVWETESREEAQKFIDTFTERLLNLGLDNFRFTLYKRTTTISTSPWVEQP